MNVSEREKDKILKVFHDIERGSTNPNQIYKILNKSITLKKIKHVLSKIDIVQQNINKNINENLNIPIVNIPDSYQIDLTFYNQYKSQNNNYVGLLTCININSRYAYCYPFKTKGINEMYNLLNNFINDAKPKIIESDNGNEFNNHKIKKLFDDHGIKFIVFNKNENKNSLGKIERFNRTIRLKISNYMKLYKTNKYIDVIDKLTKNYNNTLHSSINDKPSEANQEKIYSNELKEINDVKTKINNEFKINDHVRIYKEKDLFEKGNKNYYSSSVYKIIGKENNKFILENINNKKIKKILSNYLMKINVSDLIEKTQTRNKNINKVKSENKQYKNEMKQKRFLNKELK